MHHTHQYIVGVDESGRGPLAGPVSVGVVKVRADFDWSRLPGVADSKQLSERQREHIFKRAAVLRVEGMLAYTVAMVSATFIDKKGIVAAIKHAQARAFKELRLIPQECFIKLDGSLSAPPEFAQETIIKGDQKEQCIALASILAKVTRDRYMTRIARRFPQYDFSIHKGYGTKAHRAAVGHYGLCPLHRRSYCKNIITLYS